MFYCGLDIGSTASKLALIEEERLRELLLLPTGWSSREAAARALDWLSGEGYARESFKLIATGYGRIAVADADRVITEISCHGRGAAELMQGDGTVIDIGGQDSKIISVEKGRSVSFLMNDKCAAGTGKFLEVMANRLGVDLPELFTLAAAGTPLPISAMCTVFAESEVISHIGSGKKREDIAAGVVESVVKRVAGLYAKHDHLAGTVFLSGGLAGCSYVAERLGLAIGETVQSHPLGRYAGAIGAALLGRGQGTALQLEGVKESKV